jgi:hypothetical protein
MCEPSRAEQVNARLRERIRAYRETHGYGSPPGGFVFDQPAAVVAAAESCVAFVWPRSAWLLLNAMHWVTSQTPPAPEDRWWSEMDVVLGLLNVRHEVEPGAYERWAARYGAESASEWRRASTRLGEAWEREVETWPTEDWLLIRDWLAATADWPFVREWFAFEADAARSFWSQRG